jgi:hypothetical protein
MPQVMEELPQFGRAALLELPAVEKPREVLEEHLVGSEHAW